MKKLIQRLSLLLILSCLTLSLMPVALAAPSDDSVLVDAFSTLLITEESDDGTTITFTNVDTAISSARAENPACSDEELFAALCSAMGIDDMSRLPDSVDGEADTAYLQDMLSCSAIAVTTRGTDQYEFVITVATLPSTDEPRYLLDVRMHTTGIRGSLLMRNYTLELTHDGTLDPDYDMFGSVHLYLMEEGGVHTAFFRNTRAEGDNIAISTDKQNAPFVRSSGVPYGFPAELEMTYYLRYAITAEEPPTAEASITVQQDIPLLPIFFVLLAIVCIIWLIRRKRSGADVRARRL